MQGDTLSNYISEQSLTRRFEEAFAGKVGVAKAMAKSSAMSGLFEAVSVSGAGPGYEVICDPIVHFGGLAALFFNAVPRFADVRRDTYNMDPDSLLANITPLTRAVIVTHLWGQSAEIDTIAEICRDKDIFLIEDCATASAPAGTASTWAASATWAYSASRSSSNSPRATAA